MAECRTVLAVHWCLHIVLSVILAAVAHRYWWLSADLTTVQQNISYSSVDDNAQTPDAGAVNREPAIGSSSVWCWGNHHTNRVCHFHNLCYLPVDDEFLFLHGRESVLVGLPESRYSPALLDMSSVNDHNTQYFNYMDVDASKLHLISDIVTVVNRTSLIFRRFHPDNLMHVLHDDLLPLFHTLHMLPETRSVHPLLYDVQLAFMEGWDPGPFEELYRMFSTVNPMYKMDLQSSKNLICFRDAYVGLSKHTTWYQYGFHEPQGPIPDHNVSAFDVRRFSAFLQRRLAIAKVPEVADGRIAVVMSRKYNRLILNELELTFALVKHLHVKVVTVGMETHSVTELIDTVSRASVLVGMHGSLLSLAMFLPRGSLLVELFPYAVNPSHYTPYKTLVNLRGMGITYVAWRNIDVERSVAHPERSWDEGGISGLPKADQERIQSSQEVPYHLCCRDPEWLYRIYQDTFVDVDAVISLINNVTIADENTKDNSAQSDNGRLYPSYVRDITCRSGSVMEGLPSLTISWQPPVNVKFIDSEEINYEVWIQEEGRDDYTAWMLTKYEHTFSAGIQRLVNYNIWIRCIVDGVTGPFNAVVVSCSAV